MHIIRSSNTIATLPTIIIRSADCANFADRCLTVPDDEISGIPLHLVVNQLKHILYEILINLIGGLRVTFDIKFLLASQIAKIIILTRRYST